MEQLPNGKKLIEQDTETVYFVRDFRVPENGEFVLCEDCIECGWVDRKRLHTTDEGPRIHVNTVDEIDEGHYYKREWNILRQGKN